MTIQYAEMTRNDKIAKLLAQHQFQLRQILPFFRSTLRTLPATEALTSMMAFNRKRVLAPRTAKPSILRG
jgi:hypothetical protein